MYCPDCGTDAGEAKFCPECGADLVAFREAKAAGASDAKASKAAGAVLFSQYGIDGDDGATVGDGGSYEELIAQANALFDEGDALFNQSEIDEGAQKFMAAAQLYERAWKTQPGDANVGTGWATSLFYSGDIQGAIKRIELVLKDDPEFQTAWFNKGDYLSHPRGAHQRADGHGGGREEAVREGASGLREGRRPRSRVGGRQGSRRPAAGPAGLTP
jgi:tetratricopeptide (TPR) repeat protein